jgi:hypothetical protein
MRLLGEIHLGQDSADGVGNKPVDEMGSKLGAFLSGTILERAERETERRHSKRVCAEVNCHAEEGACAEGHRRKALGEQSVKPAHSGPKCEVHDLSAFCFFSSAEFTTGDVFDNRIRDLLRRVLTRGESSLISLAAAPCNGPISAAPTSPPTAPAINPLSFVIVSGLSVKGGISLSAPADCSVASGNSVPKHQKVAAKGGFQVGQTAKARSAHRVQSLP